MNGPRLAALRREAGMTQEQLCAAAGMSVTGLSDLERGAQKRPKLPTLQAIADVLAVQLNRSASGVLAELTTPAPESEEAAASA